MLEWEPVQKVPALLFLVRFDMRLRHITGSEEVVANNEYVVSDFKEAKGNWKKIFNNDNPVYIEIGMGKGRFIVENALKNKDINYIGIERYSSVLLRALQKLEELEEIPKNLKFICMDATEIEDAFEKEEVSKIYLNFSDPWPKDRHAKRRLPSREFLKRYDAILKKDGNLEFKTDNRGLFDFAVSELKPAGWKAEVITYDLHADEKLMEGNVMTEYEEKFSSLGNPICKYIISR